jgi:hypothetical protein
VYTHECATDTTGTPNGSAAYAKPLTWTRSGLIRAASPSSHSPARSTSRHGSAIHSSANELVSSSAFGSAVIARTWPGLGGAPIVASMTSTSWACSALISSHA